MSLGAGLIFLPPFTWACSQKGDLFSNFGQNFGVTPCKAIVRGTANETRI